MTASPKGNPKVKTHIDAMRTTEMNFLVDAKACIFYREDKSVKLDEKIHLHHFLESAGFHLNFMLLSAF